MSSRKSLFRVPFQTASESVWQPRKRLVQKPDRDQENRRQETCINELFQIIIQVGKVILPSFVIRNKLLFSLKQLLSLLLQSFTLRPFVIYARNHQGILVIILVFGMLGKEFLDGDKRQLLVFVAMIC